MIEDLRQLARGTVIAADVCLLGAGAAGITLARELAGSGLRICLAEGGGSEFEYLESQALYQGVNVGIPISLEGGRLRYLGGSTNLGENPENQTLAERCLTSFGYSAGPVMLPLLYNNNYEIAQSKDTVAIVVEMVHDVRLIHIGAKHRTDGHPPRRRPSSTTTSPSSLVNGGSLPTGSNSSTASDGRHKRVPSGVTTSGRFIRIGCRTTKSSN